MRFAPRFPCRTRGDAMLDTIQSMSLLTIAEIVGPILLGAALIYGIIICAAGACSSQGRRRAPSTHRTTSNARARDHPAHRWAGSPPVILLRSIRELTREG